MVSILPPKRNIWNALGDAMSQFGANAPQLLEERYQTQRGLSAIDQLQKDLQEANGDISKILPAVAKAQSLNKNLERSGFTEHALKLAQAQALNKTPTAGELDGGFQTPQKQSLPSFLNKNDQVKEATEFFPTNVGPKEQVGNVPQEATTGIKMPLLSPDEYSAKARQLATERTKNGIPTSPMQAMEEIKLHEEDKKLHNAKVDDELKQRVSGQKTYGDRSVGYLNKALPGAPEEVQAYFQKLGENVSKEGKSEAEINRYLAEKAKNFSNSVANIKNDITAPRLHKNLARGFLGTYKSFDEAANDARKHLKPLLDAQLYDYSRNLLAEQGYYPEEREIIVNPLTDKSVALLNSVKDQPKPERIGGMAGTPIKLLPNAGDKEDIKTALQELKRIEPNFSLPLARKTFEDKNYGWRTFKDALNELQEEGFELEDDQRTQMGYLDSPPLTELERILHGLNLQGR